VAYTGAFEDDDVTHVEGDVNPVRDLDIISEELRLKDVEFLNTHLEKLEKLVIRGNDKKLKPEYVSIELQLRLPCVLYFNGTGRFPWWRETFRFYGNVLFRRSKRETEDRPIS